MQVLREADSDILSFLSCGILFRIYLEYSDCPSIGKSSVQHSDPLVYSGAATSAWSMCGRCASRWTDGRRGWTTIPPRSCADSSASFRSGSGPSTITLGIVFSLPRATEGVDCGAKLAPAVLAGRLVAGTVRYPPYPFVFGRQ
jgi:hypothetical protein